VVFSRNASAIAITPSLPNALLPKSSRVSVIFARKDFASKLAPSTPILFLPIAKNRKIEFDFKFSAMHGMSLSVRLRDDKFNLRLPVIAMTLSILKTGASLVDGGLESTTLILLLIASNRFFS
jgi:hypothetical protein